MSAEPVLHEFGCSHVDLRFEGAWRSEFDVSVGPAVTAGRDAIDRFLSDRDVRSLLLSGPVGCGKTHLAAIASNELAEPLWRTINELEAEAERQKAASDDSMTRYELEFRINEYLRPKLTAANRKLDRECPRWISVPRLLGGLKRDMSRRQDRDSERPAESLAWQKSRPKRESWAQVVDDVLASSGLLVLDDLGSEKASEWTRETLFELVAERYDNYGRVIVTSNLSAAELRRSGYERIVSRIADEGLLLEMRTARDYRQRNRKTLAVAS